MRRSIIWTKLTKAELAKAVKLSCTFTEILKHFGLDHIGGNCKTLKHRLNKENIDYSHIPQGIYASRGRCNFQIKPTPYEQVLVENSSFARKTARRAILRAGLIEYKCAICGLDPIWNGKPISLRLDHINGVRNDHRLKNLRFLCPNCDSQTDTYGSRNCERAPERKCIQCNGFIPRRSKSGICSKCSRCNRSDIPSSEELYKLVWEFPTTKIATKFGVSDKAVAKWCKKYKIDKPGPGYWAKIQALK